MEKLNKATLRHGLLLLTCIMLASFTHGQPRHYITVKFESAAGNNKVYITSSRSVIDSSYIKSGEARFLLPAKEKEWMWYSIMYRNKKTDFYTLLFHNGASDITLIVDSALTHYTIRGDTNAAIQNEFNQGLFTLYTQMKSLEVQLNKAADSTEKTSLKTKLASFNRSYRDYCVNWVSKHRADPFSVAVILTYIDKTNIWHTLDTVAAQCFDELLPAAKKDNYVAYLMQRRWSMYSEKYAQVQVNTMAPAFLIKDTAGNHLSLQNFRGKWLLVDFWASWCGPCRQNNPLLKTFAAKYGGKGLEIISISVDTDKNRWKNEIIKDGMTWYQGSDLKGLDAGVAKAWGVGAVPIYFLVSPEGLVVTRSLGGEIGEIEKTLSKTIVY